MVIFAFKINYIEIMNPKIKKHLLSEQLLSFFCSVYLCISDFILFLAKVLKPAN